MIDVDESVLRALNEFNCREGATVSSRRSVFYDTFDGRLHRKGSSLCATEDEGEWRLAWRNGSDGGSEIRSAHPIEFFPAPHRAWLEERGRVDAQGIAHLVERPKELLVMVCGGLGNLHAMGLHNFGPTRAVTRAIVGEPTGAD